MTNSNLKSLTGKIFNLKKGEEKTVLLLTGYSFFMGLAYAYFYTTSITLFLEKFEITMLPYAYMGQGVVSYFIWLLYKRLEKNMIFSRLFLVSGIFLLLSVIGLSSGYFLTSNKWYVFGLFVWYNIFLLLNGIGFWGIAAKIFDLRQAKRLFGLIGSGETFARVISFMSVPFLLKIIKTSDLLYFSIAGLIICLILIPIIVNNLGDRININKIKEVNIEQKTKKGFSELFKNKYFGFIFLLALFPLFATFYVDFMFLGQIKLQFTDPKVISGFLSIFMGTMSVAEFLLKTFLSGRLLTKYGILFGIIMLPVTLAFSTFCAAAYGTLYGAIGLFFSFIILSRLFVRVARTLFFDPVFQVLYQPIPINDRLALQSKVEGVSKSIGFIFAGAVLLLLTNVKFLNVVFYNYIFLAVIGLWIWVSYKLYHEYRGTLHSALATLINYKGRGTNFSLFTAFSALIDKANYYRAIVALNLTERIQPSVSNMVMLRLLPQTEPRLQLNILKRMEESRFIPAVRMIDYYLDNNSVNTIAPQFSKTKLALEKDQNVDFKTVASWASSNQTNDRLHAANLLGYYENFNNYKLLISLLQDDDIQIRNAAILSAGKLKKRELWPYIIKNLSNKDSAYTATIAIKQIGDPILNSLINLFGKDDLDKNTQIHLAKLLGHFDDQRVIKLLKSKISAVDEDVRKHIFVSLRALEFQFAPSELQVIKNYIEEDIDCIAWIVASILDVGDDELTATLKKGLELELKRKREFVFLQLSLMYDPKIISFFINGFEDASQESRAYALEVLDMTIPSDIKELILPLLSDLTYPELLKAYDLHFAQQRLLLKDRLLSIVNKNYSKINYWNKANAMLLLADFEDSWDTLVANTLNDSVILSQTATWVLFKKNPTLLLDVVNRFTGIEKLKVTNIINGLNRTNNRDLLIVDIITSLKTNPFFDEIYEFDLISIAESAIQLFIKASSSFKVEKSGLKDMFFVMQGELEIDNGIVISPITKQQIYWYVQNGQSDILNFTAKEDGILLQINADNIFQILSEKISLSKTIINIFSEQYEYAI
ncbi:MAG TPA: hypothetical protein VK705_04130 [Ferruginibacter sp.]|nr:hypothetical protein [Ferruginibacter sp.]